MATPKSRPELIQDTITTISLLIRSFFSKKALVFQGQDVSPGQLRVLFLLSHEKGMSVSDLADKLCITSGGVTQFIDGLVEKGLVERTEDSQDRRVQRLVLTENAERTHKAYHKQYIEQAIPMFDRLSDAELSQLMMLLAKIAKPSK